MSSMAPLWPLHSRQRERTSVNAVANPAVSAMPLLRQPPFLPPEAYPLSPPPPYHVANDAWTAQPAPFYQQPHQSEQRLPPTSSNTLRPEPARFTSAPHFVSPRPTPLDPQIPAWQATFGNSEQAGDMNAIGDAVTWSMNAGAALCDRVASRLNDALCRSEDESSQVEGHVTTLLRDFSLGHDVSDDPRARRPPLDQPQEMAGQAKSAIIDFSKTWMYANSRLPPQMMPLKVYIPTWSIFCRAADASIAVYDRPKVNERQDYIAADWRHGTKAMTLSSVCLDEKNLIVFAIRGSKWNIFDWAVNFRPAPAQPVGFLDDTGNACHSGFLHVAKAMIRPVAARLRQLLEQDPSRAGSSLVLTGHSAGGAVASLLYMHMLSTLVKSELNILTGCFRRVHCVTFGAPPVSLLPLQKPNNEQRKKNIFIAFANEGDPVVRADMQYVASLCRLIASPAPTIAANQTSTLVVKAKASRLNLKRGDDRDSARPSPAPTWSVPDATLSNAGRVVLLRNKPARKQGIEAVCVSDQDLRGVIFGDPSMHDMTLYKRRIDELAIAAVTGRDS